MAKRACRRPVETSTTRNRNLYNPKDGHRTCPPLVKTKKTIVNVLLRNRVATFVTDIAMLERLNEILRFRVSGWQYTPAAKYRGWNGYIRMITRFGNVGAGLFVAMKEKMEQEADIEFVVDDQRQAQEIAWEIHGAIEDQVRGYQRECFEKMIAASNMGGLILNATGCLDGDTLIDCPRNLESYPYGIPIRALVGRKPWVYCWDENKKRIALAKSSKVWKSGLKVPVYKVTFKVRGFGSRFGSRKVPPLDSIVGTADHPFLLYKQKAGRKTNAGHDYESVGYTNLKDLQPGDRVMALYRSFGIVKGGYSYVHLNNGTGMPEHRFIATELFGPRPQGWHAHHKNENGFDNRVTNVAWKTYSAHASHHAKKRNEYGTFIGWRETGVHPRGMLGKSQTDHQKAIARKTAKKNIKRGNKFWESSPKYKKYLEKQPNHVVEKVEFAGYKDVYNMTVPGQENFVANGVVTHNTGKTFIAGLYCKALKGNALFVVDELTLLKQAQAELTKVMGEEVGEIGNSIFDPQRISVGTIQTIHRHRFDKKFTPWSNRLHVIILDEMHLALARRNIETIKTIRPAVVFGLTATLELKKKIVAMKAYELAGPVIFSYPLQQGVREGFLSKGVAISVRVDNPIEVEKVTGGNWYQRRRLAMLRYPREYEAIIVRGVDRNQTIVDLVEWSHKLGKYTIVLVERVKHLHHLSQELSHIPHEVVFGEKEVIQRQISNLKFEAGVSRVILTTKVFKKGINIKRVDVIIDGAGMKSRNDAVQKYGRGVRMCEEKAGLIYLDIADVGNRFENAGKGRALALKKIGVPVFKVSSELGAERILALAEEKLSKL